MIHGHGIHIDQISCEGQTTIKISRERAQAIRELIIVGGSGRGEPWSTLSAPGSPRHLLSE